MFSQQNSFVLQLHWSVLHSISWANYIILWVVQMRSVEATMKTCFSFLTPSPKLQKMLLSEKLVSLLLA